MTHGFTIVWLDVVEKIFYNADEWSCPDSETYEQEYVILLETLSWSSIWSLDEDSWIPAIRKISVLLYIADIKR